MAYIFQHASIPAGIHDKFPNAYTNKDVVRAVSASTNEDIVQITKLHCETAADGTSCASRLFPHQMF